jgi:hypothetical protein
MNFYTLREAANAIAAQLHPSDDDKRAAEADRYWHLIYGKLCAGEVTGRDPSGRDPIDHTRLGAVIAFHGCVINERDLNEWLDRFGNGVQVSATRAQAKDNADDSGERNEPGRASPIADRPTSAQLAEALGPHLTVERGQDTLEAMLNDVRGRPRLARFRKMVKKGARDVATWEVGGVVVYLIAENYLERNAAEDALRQCYPAHLYALEQLPESDNDSPVARWVPVGLTS